MNDAKLNLTPERRYEMDLRLELELSQSIRQQRILDREVSFYHSGAQPEPERSILDNLDREHAELLADTFVACSDSKKREVTGVISNIVALIRDREGLADAVAGKGKSLREVDAEIVKVNDLKSQVPTELAQVERCLAGKKTLEVLESKLDSVIKQCCTVVTENRDLREEIDHMLIERMNFNKLWEGYITNLSNGKKLMMDIFEQATIAYDQRDEWITRLNALRKRALDDLRLHVSEMTSLRKKMDNERLLEEFMAIKGQFRNMSNLEEKTIREREAKRKLLDDCLSKHKAIINEIKAYTRINPQTETGKVIQIYVDSEERNISTFNYVNELQSQMEVITERVMDKQKEIDQQWQISQGFVVRQKEGIKELRGALAKAKKEADESSRQLNATNSTLKSLYVGIGRLFQICKCSKEPFMQLLHDFGSVNDHNVFCFVEVLEGTVINLLANVYFRQITTVPLQKKTAKAEQEVIDSTISAPPNSAIQDIIPTNPCPLCTDRELVSDVIDTLQYALTRDEVADKLSLRLALPDGLEKLHNVSACHLPKSRQIIQKRLQ
ncbi:uncharacterized protein LOC116161328 isoform X2 [Photinus pyralis]|uniref:uncharacterized protein LOC116161328 isoform X2 n=1 Tax=Photinus pyralis TaxID=7054 RepID=UPI0012673C9B|nr:uncharacterized protein LOC116161328 isoform X2 [Photinus pyralis]